MTIDLQMTQVKMQDQLINPFVTDTDSIDFLTVMKVHHLSNKLSQGLFIEFRLHTLVHTMTRTRYSFWQALGDIGGFHDGLVLLVRLFMGPISAFVFKADFLKKGKYAKAISTKNKLERAELAKVLSNSKSQIPDLHES